MSKQFKSGFVAIVGRPNVGKSTFMNYVLGQKIAIMSDKAQTTRNKIQGVYTNQDCQIVFLDTPGIHKPKHELGNFMVESAYSALKEVDAVLFMVNAAEKRGPGDDFIIEKLICRNYSNFSFTRKQCSRINDNFNESFTRGTSILSK